MSAIGAQDLDTVALLCKDQLEDAEHLLRGFDRIRDIRERIHDRIQKRPITRVLSDHVAVVSLGSSEHEGRR